MLRIPANSKTGGFRPSLNTRAFCGSLGNRNSLYSFSSHSIFSQRRINREGGRKRRLAPVALSPFDQAWAPNVDAQSLAPQLFAFSIVPYSGFLYHLTRSKSCPPLALFGFYFLLVFVGVSIPAGIYAKVHYGQSLANVDWLHGGAESFLTITNLLIVLGMRQGIREAEETSQAENMEEEEEIASPKITK